MFNRYDDLNSLKLIFVIAEKNQSEQNKNLFSLKHTALWLCAYALMDDKNQRILLSQLKDKAKIEGEEKMGAIKKNIDGLIEPDALAHIISEYKSENGDFIISVNNVVQVDSLLNKMAKLNYDTFLPAYIKLNCTQNEPVAFDTKDGKFSLIDSTEENLNQSKVKASPLQSVSTFKPQIIVRGNEDSNDTECGVGCNLF